MSGKKADFDAAKAATAPAVKLPPGVTANSGKLQALAARVFAAGGKVSADEAVDFVAALMMGSIMSPGQSGTERLGLLPEEMKIDLHQSISRAFTPDKQERLDDSIEFWNHFGCLNRLNRAMKPFSSAFYRRRAAVIESYFADAGKLERLWNDFAAKPHQIKYGQKTVTVSFSEPKPPPFADAMRAVADEELDWGSTLLLSKFIAETYAEHCGHRRPRFELADLKEGGASYSRRNGEDIITMGADSIPPDGEPSWTIKFVFHESEHANQRHMVDLLEAGKIQRGDRDYIPARIFAANNVGYISLANLLAADRSYERQPLEIAARRAQNTALKCIRRIYGNDRPLPPKTPTAKSRPKRSGPAA